MTHGLRSSQRSIISPLFLTVGAVSLIFIVASSIAGMQVPQRELVSYLTAASVLQMSQVVEKCVQAISQYLSPTTPFLNLTRLSEEKETQQLSSRWLGSSFDNPKERDAALPDAIIHKTNSKEVGTVVVNPRLTAGQEAKVDTIGLREPREAKIDLSQDAECCLDMLKLGKEGDALPCYTSNPLSHAPHTAGNPHPSAVLHDLMSSTATMISSAADTELVNSSKNQHEQDVKDSPKEEKKTG